MDSDLKNDKIVLLSEDNDKQTLISLSEILNTFEVRIVSSYKDCFKEIDDEVTKIVIVCKNEESWDYEYFINKIKLTNTSPDVIVISNKINDALYINSLYQSGFSSYLIRSNKNWEKNLLSAIRYLIRNQKLEEINRKLTMRLTEANMMLNEKNLRLDDFCRTIAHDIRGALGGLVMRLDYINDNFEDIAKDRLKTLVNTSLGVCERLISQVQAMYDFAKLGSEATKMEELDLNALILSLIEDMNLTNNKAINFDLETLPMVYGSKELIKRLFLNLITNAIKYNDKEQKMIKIGQNGIESLPSGNFLKLYVKDNGNGIPKDELKNVFKLFNRASEEKGTKEGLGVGLTVVERVIELHLGKIEIKSKVGEGTSFEFTLPVKEN